MIKLDDKMAAEYRRLAYEAAWAEAAKLDPENAPKLRKLISN